ncbi:transmembrane sensor [Luteibacter sp. Sphag1AF]|uniref:FecR family protein n=1 Tax=Luteibacter sp. Sphag1AF TaxID=2587031 RepID=UPI001609F03F|nr:FecR domain-containing protein [Luteibacter sp. Sphag1AF]MBB3225883.1 transmembrane sensor [Luteibacter sp. Sphag1AF]
MNSPARPRFGNARVRSVVEQAAEWYVELGDDNDAAMEARFMAWLAEAPEHVAEYLAIAQLHGDLKAISRTQGVPTRDLVASAAAEPAVVPIRPPVPPRTSSTARPRRRMWRGALAACACLAVAGAALLSGLGTSQDGQIYTNNTASVREITLPDGTVIQLDKASRVAVNFDARLRRVDIQRGGALIDVGKDPVRPLLVTMGSHIIQDIGTVFDVHRVPGRDSVTVINGQVTVWTQQHPWIDALNRRMTGTLITGNVVANLSAGERVNLDADGGVSRMRESSTASTLAWMPSDIRFQHAQISEVARQFNRHTTLPLVIEDRQIGKREISGVFHADDADAFVAWLATQPGVHVERESNEIRIRASEHPVARQGSTVRKDSRK